MTLEDEINDLVRQLTTTEDEDVRDAADIVCREYGVAVRAIHSLDGVERMLQKDIVAVEKRLQDRLLRARENVRDRLRGLVEWARASGKM